MDTPSKQILSLPCIENLKAHDVTWLSPWQFAERPRLNFIDKAAYKAYITNSTTKSCLYSGASGLNPNQRVSSQNPVTRLHAIIADYDTVIDETKRSKVLERLTVKPSFISRSFSGGTHAIWFLKRLYLCYQITQRGMPLWGILLKSLNLNPPLGRLMKMPFIISLSSIA